MTDLKNQIDELTTIKASMSRLKERKEKIEAEIIKQCSLDLENTKYKSDRQRQNSAIGYAALSKKSCKLTVPQNNRLDG